MKINKKNPLHWIYLFNFSLLTLLTIPIRPLVKVFKKKPLVVLYGHKLSGNLLALKKGLSREYPDIQVKFLTMDPQYYRQNKHNEFLFAQNPIHMLKSASAECVVADRGLHALIFYLKATDMRFFDVWHGIPFKGFDKEDFKVQQRFDQTWVASPLLKELYINRFGFDANRVAITGYARTDSLVVPEESSEQIRDRMGLKHTTGNKLVLFAPTWKQDLQHRSLFPFSVSAQNFFENLVRVCKNNGAMLLFRAHLNSIEPMSLPEGDVIQTPFAGYPDTEALLQISDALICDWSSIAFDYLLLDRPTLFLDVEPPFKKGFSLGPEYRFGPVVTSLPELVTQLEYSLANPEDYWAKFGHRHEKIRKEIYGDFADGNATERCMGQLDQFLSFNRDK